MAKRKTTKRGKKNNNSFMIFFFVVIILAILSFAVSYFVIQADSSEMEKIVQTENVNTDPEPVSTIVSNALEGTWASYNDGAMLTVRGQNFTIELPSVESSVIASGKILVKDNKVTFVYTNQDSGCGIKPGEYVFTFDSDDEFTFKVVDDSCKSRKDQLSATWFKI